MTAPEHATPREPLVGAHVSSAGGTHQAPPRAQAIGAIALQLFTKQANQWRERECDDVETTSFRAALVASGARFTMAHDSYLINLASPDPALRARSIASFTAEMRRSETLGLDAVVSHPGNFMDDHDAGLARNADAIAESLAEAPGRVRLLLETTAGSGTALGRTFEELAEIIERLPSDVRGRVGVCLDTCHVYAAGYDIVADYDGVMRHFDAVLGLERLGALHLNDSKHPMGSRKDRHELIAEGTLGEAPFRRIMNDERLHAVPKVLETPKLDDAEATDRRMLALLRSYVE